MLKEMLQKKQYMAIAVAVLAILIFLIVKSFGYSAVDPAKDKLNEDPDGGKSYALVYNYSDFYALTEELAVLKSLKNDLGLYARTFYDYFENEDTLVGFTFKDGIKDLGNGKSEFKGKFYGVKGEVRITTQSIPNNLVRVSIVDQNDSSIDEKLSLNGPFSRLVEKLPIDESTYSIRYLPQSSKVIATFYQGYSIADVDTVEAKLKELLGAEPTEYNIDYSVNARGEYSINEIRTSQATLTLAP